MRKNDNKQGQFKIICQVCNSENCDIKIKYGEFYLECKECKNNDK